MQNVKIGQLEIFGYVKPCFQQSNWKTKGFF